MILLTLYRLHPHEFSESEPAASPIALIEVDDQDHDDVFSFSLVSGFGDRDNDLFSISDNQLIINVDSDFEQKDTYLIRLQVTDSGGLSFEDQFSLAVTDSNDPPLQFALRRLLLHGRWLLATLWPGCRLWTRIPTTSLFSALLLVKGMLITITFSILDQSTYLESSPALADQNEYHLRLRVTDKAGLFHEERLVLALPTSILSSTTGFDESLNVGSIIF